MKPILFNTEMVRAILDGRKTVTRRIIKPYPNGAHAIIDCEDNIWYFMCGVMDESGRCFDWSVAVKQPYQIGDILYVRERFCMGRIDSGEEADGTSALYVSQCAGEADCIPYEYCVRNKIGIDDVVWKPSLHMPKEAARIFLKVTGIRAEQLHNITNDEAKAEGILGLDPYTYQNSEFYNTVNPDNNWIATFAGLWNSTVKKPDIPLYGWDANPWVWVIEFERCEKPEAQP